MTTQTANLSYEERVEAAGQALIRLRRDGRTNVYEHARAAFEASGIPALQANHQSASERLGRALIDLEQRDERIGELEAERNEMELILGAIPAGVLKGAQARVGLLEQCCPDCGRGIGENGNCDECVEARTQA